MNNVPEYKVCDECDQRVDDKGVISHIGDILCKDCNWNCEFCERIFGIEDDMNGETCEVCGFHICGECDDNEGTGKISDEDEFTCGRCLHKSEGEGQEENLWLPAQ